MSLLPISSTVWAGGIPEPSLIFYGTIRNAARFNARVTSGMLSWQIRQPDTLRTVTVAMAISNVLDQFSYVLVVPCETRFAGPVSANALELNNTPALFDRSQVSVDGHLAAFVDPIQTVTNLASRNRGTIERIDLTIDIPCADVDGRGLCDDWEILFFGSTGHFPNDDEDADGMTNLEECIAGTNPNDTASVFQLINYAPLSDAGMIGFQVEWDSAEGRTYSLLRSTTLLPGSFSVVASNIAAVTPRNTFVDTNATPPGPYFYTLFIEP